MIWRRCMKKEWRKKYEGGRFQVNEILALGARPDGIRLCGIGITCGATPFRVPGTGRASP
jgi:hypothetical protein